MNEFPEKWKRKRKDSEKGQTAEEAEDRTKTVGEEADSGEVTSAQLNGSSSSREKKISDSSNLTFVLST